MTHDKSPWYITTVSIRVAQFVGIAEMLGGLAVLVVKHDEAQGFAFLCIGAATFGSMPWIRGRSRPSSNQ